MADRQTRKAIAAVATGLVACAGTMPVPTEAPEPTARLNRIEAAASPEQRSEARGRLTLALDALADAYEQLMSGETATGTERLVESHALVRSAQASLPPDVLVVATRSGERLRLASPREPVRLELSAIPTSVLERLRPYRPRGATEVRVDLDELERRLAQALALPPERALGELFLAAGRSLAFVGAESQPWAEGAPLLDRGVAGGGSSQQLGG